MYTSFYMALGYTQQQNYWVMWGHMVTYIWLHEELPDYFLNACWYLYLFRFISIIKGLKEHWETTKGMMHKI